MENKNEYLTPDEAAQRIGVHSSTIRQWIRKGILPAKKIGLRGYTIKISDLDKMIQPTKKE